MNKQKWSWLLLGVLATAVLTAGSALAVTDDADYLIVGPGEVYSLGGVHNYNVSVVVDVDGILNVTPYTGSANTGYLELHAPTITIGGLINGNGAGYRGLYQTGGEGPGGGNYPGSGGSYGGQGGASGWNTAAKPPYGTSDGLDMARGSGGSGQTRSSGGNGGGLVYVDASLDLVITGNITVDGDQGQDLSSAVNGDGGGGGSGGCIFLKAPSPTIFGNLNANGGRGGNAALSIRRGGGGGGGGRIKIFYHCFLDMPGVMSVLGGAAGTGPLGNGSPGSPGTTYNSGTTAPVITSILDVGNDQGRHVRLSWLGACADDPQDIDPVVRYAIWRRVDILPAAEKSAEDAWRKSYPEGDWDFVAEMPSRGEANYSIIVPTLADSNVAGMFMTTFFVSGVTTNPFVYHDSAPDSGYSVDNLAPAAPLNLKVEDTVITWDPATEEDWNYYSVYASTSPVFDGSATLLQQSTDNQFPIGFPAHPYYFITATDFNGNESQASTPAQPSGVGDTPRVKFGISSVAPNPFNPRTTISINLGDSGPMELAIYDLSGRLVRVLASGDRPAGRYDVTWDGLDDHGRATPTGNYLCRLIWEQGVQTRKLLLIK